MISIEEIDKTILDLENHDTTYATCEKLAWLYIVRDHLVSPITNVALSPQSDDSDFLSAASNKNISDILSIIDEHLQVIELLYPKEYNAVIKKIREL